MVRPRTLVSLRGLYIRGRLPSLPRTGRRDRTAKIRASPRQDSMGKGISKYVAKVPDVDGNIAYTSEEHAVWHDLIVRQRPIVDKYACPEYLDALEKMHFPTDRIPQCSEVSTVLKKHTGWEVAPVPALIPFGQFFQLLADKKFPAASFIRSREEMDYLQEPDIFHEIFGHTPLLTDPRFAEFTH